MRLEDLTPGARITGITADAPVTVVAVGWLGGSALRLAYRTDADHAGAGMLDERILYRDHEPKLGIAKRGTAFDLTADAATFKLAAEALRFLLADDPGAGKTIMAGLYIKGRFPVM